MDPLTAIGAAASIGQLLDLTEKAAVSAWSAAQSIIHAPEEVARLGGKLTRLKLLIVEIEKQKQIADLDDLFPTGYRNLIYDLLESNTKALDELQSLVASSSSGSLTVRNRMRWATVDKKRARSILADIRDAENCLDTACTMITMRLGSRNQVSLNALRNNQETFRCQTTDGFRTLGECIKEQQSLAVEQISLHTETEFTDSRNDVKIAVEEITQILQGVLTSGLTHTKMLEDLTTLQAGIREDLHSLNHPDKSERGRQTLRGQGTEVKSSFTESRSQTARIVPTAAEDSFGCFPENSIPDSSYFTNLLSYEMKRPQHQFYWSRGSLNDWRTDSSRLPRVGTTWRGKTTAHRRKMHLVLRAGLRLINRHIIQLEIRLQQNTRYWMSIPWLGCSLTTINIRPSSALIFKACHDWDLETVRYLLETGQASVHDVDGEMQSGLLEHLLWVDTRKQNSPDKLQPHGKIEFRVQLLLEYLLDAGCDPNVYNGVSSHACPAVLFTFYIGCTDITSRLISRGADIESFALSPSPMLYQPFADKVSYFRKQFELLVSIGFSDWEGDESNSSSLLHGACRNGDWDAFFFALEVVRLDPDISAEKMHRLTPLSIGGGRMSMAAVLIQCGAAVNDNDPWYGSYLSKCIPTNIYRPEPERYFKLHFLLYHGADPSLQVLWQQVWEILRQCSDPNKVHISNELMVTHLLLHGADPFAPARYTWKNEYNKAPWYHYATNITSSEFARACSFPDYVLNGVPHATPAERDSKLQFYESFELNRKSKWQWFTHGRRLTDMSKFCDVTFDVSDWDKDFMNDDPKSRMGGSEARSRKPMYTSRFPAVEFLCNALNRAGYRAETDSEGDVWFEDDDGDIYYDALEDQSHYVRSSERHEFNCYICRDLRKYGLGQILDDIEEGTQRLYAYREKLKAEKKRWHL